VEVDSRLYVDPHLLEASAVSELKGARTTFEGHFEKVLKLLRQSKRPDGIFWVDARQLLTFKEVPQTALGHGKDDTSGSGIRSDSRQGEDIANVLRSALVASGRALSSSRVRPESATQSE